MDKKRCKWAGELPIYIDYHDNEWGKPQHDDKKLFEMLVLESMQAGLSWITILKKREALREAFDNFDVKKVVNYEEEKIEELLNNEKIIRNKNKIMAAINNAKIFISIQNEYGSFDKFIWSYVDNNPILNSWNNEEEVPPKTELSDKISKDMKKLGFKFIGSTIIYSFMQGIGMVNDHVKTCYLYKEKESKN